MDLIALPVNAAKDRLARAAPIAKSITHARHAAPALRGTAASRAAAARVPARPVEAAPISSRCRVPEAGGAET